MKEKTIEHIQEPFSYCTAETFYMKNEFKKLKLMKLYFLKKMEASFDSIAIQMVKEQ